MKERNVNKNTKAELKVSWKRVKGKTINVIKKSNMMDKLEKFFLECITMDIGIWGLQETGTPFNLAYKSSFVLRTFKWNLPLATKTSSK